MLHMVLFWVFGSAVILINTRRIAIAEFLITAGMVGIIALIGVLGFPDFFIKTAIWEVPRLFAIEAVGPILFALSGALAIPEVVAYFRETKIERNSLRRAIVLGGVIPGIAYLIFVVGIIGLSGTVSEDSVSGLIGGVSNGVLAVIGMLGFLSLISSYIVVGLSARRILNYDLKFSAVVSGIIVVVVPLVLYIAGFQNFIEAVTFVGSFFMPIEILLIVLIWLRVRALA